MLLSVATPFLWQVDLCPSVNMKKKSSMKGSLQTNAGESEEQTTHTAL